MTLNATPAPLLPGAIIGILGGGQLGRMLAYEARRMGYGVHIFTPEPGSPAGAVADREVVAAYDDLNAVADFARGVDVVTFEFENVLTATAQAAAQCAPVHPAEHVLHITQHRLREKTFLRENGFPVAPHAPVNSLADLQAALQTLGVPAILKTAGWGYDGKGQSRIDRPEQAEQAWQSVGAQPAVLEAFVDFECELSLVAARGADGSFAAYEPLRNDHARHILDVTVAPGGFPPQLAAQAESIARNVLQALTVVGVMTVEFFLTAQGKLLINELAPRVHNSGHATYGGCVTSQFEQHIRAICGLPLGDTARLAGGVAMVNLLGDLWAQGEPNWPAMLAACPGVKLHLYGKSDPRPGRKMGHLLALAETPQQAREQALAARAALQRP